MESERVNQGLLAQLSLFEGFVVEEGLNLGTCGIDFNGLSENNRRFLLQILQTANRIIEKKKKKVSKTDQRQMGFETLKEKRHGSD